ncbi:TPA_asm: coat protein [ssRNA phage SRR5467139_2]|uniref:Coat protein n=1 Tax=ssRNA phage SRR5467139_2 TaxID=2786477 RepID=A0A8S5KZW0_9VIRU|nr:coat protein [ssRNA phage SRR5467139_2]DAD50921.1 TPA_asm: coat protein [ssRNA phage SRR5467139_2]
MQHANITVKAANGTTDVVFVAKSPFAGDRSPATWAVDADSVYRDQRTVATHASRPHGTKKARRDFIDILVPVVRTIDGNPVRVDTIPFRFESTVGNSVTDTEANEATARAVNLLASVLMKSAIAAKENFS